ncbi:fungal hydrophobin domain-containing protein [Penicillium verhagenii]|nr:fungal hydrophobin domain-containing protein [Penicillium verhagenii]
MKISIILIMASAGAALAHPTFLDKHKSPASTDEQKSSACPNKLYSVPSCCSNKILDISQGGCSNPSGAHNGTVLKSSCGAQMPLCCGIHGALTGALCVDPIGA